MDKRKRYYCCLAFISAGAAGLWRVCHWRRLRGKTCPVFLLACFFLPLAGFAQTAEWMDSVLTSQEVSYAQAAAVILPAAGILDTEAGEAEAFARAREWLPRGARADAPISLGRLSYLVTRSFGLSGGFMYALFPGPRYAYRALAWRRLLPLRPDPGRKVSGGELFYITGRVLSYTGEIDPEFRQFPLNTAPQEEDKPPEVKQGEGLSSGHEGIMSYEGKFELE